MAEIPAGFELVPEAQATGIPEGFELAEQPAPEAVQQPITQPLQPEGITDAITPITDDSGAVPVDSIQPVEPTLGQEVAGGLEAAGTVISSAIAEPIAGLAGLITAPFVGIEDATKNIEAVRDFITLDTESEIGQRNLKAVGSLVEKGVDLANIPTSGLVGLGEVLAGQGFEQASKSVERVQKEGLSTVLGDRVFDATGDPALAAAAHSLPTAALEALGVKGLKSTRLADQKLSSNIAEAIQEAAPDIKTIRSRATDAYNKLDDLGIRVRPQVYEDFANKLSNKLNKEGIDPTLHPKSTAVINRIIDDIGDAKTLSELETLRKIAKGAASSIDPPDARLGTLIVRDIDDALDSLSGQIGGQFKEARALSQRAFKSQSIADMIEDASHTASGLENGLRNEARKLLKNRKKRRGFTKDELDALRKIEQGTTVGNMAKFLGKFGISEGQATSMLGASIGIGGGGAIGSVFGPGGAAIGALTVPALGQVAKKTAQRITLDNTKFADDLVRSGKSAKEITKAYLKHTPIADRNVSDLTDIFLDANLKSSDIKGLPSSKSVSGKLIADAVHFANEIKRRSKQAGSAALITTPSVGEE